MATHALVRGVLFQDLPANILGCFIIGMLSNGDTLASVLRLPFARTDLAALPAGSALQRHTSLHVGMRTGLCGSLTTFASWELQTVLMAVGGTKIKLGAQWTQSICGLILSSMCSMASLVMGQHAAAGMYCRFNDTPVSPAWHSRMQCSDAGDPCIPCGACLLLHMAASHDAVTACGRP
jgi:fluoride ion exporter CrcB/FEX